MTTPDGTTPFCVPGCAIESPHVHTNGIPPLTGKDKTLTPQLVWTILTNKPEERWSGTSVQQIVRNWHAAEQRAEKAEAELAALRETCRDLGWPEAALVPLDPKEQPH